MGDVLFRDGQVVFDGGQVVFTDDPGTCKCCGGVVPHETTSCSDRTIIRPHTITAIISGIATNGSFAGRPPITAGYPIGNCDDVEGPPNIPDGTPSGGHESAFWSCLLRTSRRVTTAAAICTCSNSTVLMWDDSVCDLSDWNCFNGIHWCYCDFDRNGDGISGPTCNTLTLNFTSTGSVAWLSAQLTLGGLSDVGGSATYTNFAAGGFPLVSGSHNTIGTHVLVRTVHNNTNGCNCPTTLTVVCA